MYRRIPRLGSDVSAALFLTIILFNFTLGSRFGSARLDHPPPPTPTPLLALLLQLSVPRAVELLLTNLCNLAWYSGAWYSGAWCSGAWYGGAWCSGAWYSGAYSGAWYSGSKLWAVQDLMDIYVAL